MKTHLLLYTLASILLISCNEIKSTKNNIKDKLIDELSRPSTKKISLFDIFPKLKNDEYQVTDIEGLQCDYLVFFYKYYFKYSGNRERITEYISNIQCHYSEIVPDTALIKSDPTSFEKETRAMTKYEYDKAQFFFKYKETDVKYLEFYTCIKTPEKHYIVFDTKSNIIYHMIENFRE